VLWTASALTAATARAHHPPTDSHWGESMMKSPIAKRSIGIGGHKTSVSLEDAFWIELKKIATRSDTTLAHLVGVIDTKRQQGNLSSAIRLFVLGFYLDQISQYENRFRTQITANGTIPAARK
jgi:predicted DNA-binding ribbon-helix-helix protein